MASYGPFNDTYAGSSSLTGYIQSRNPQTPTVSVSLGTGSGGTGFSVMGAVGALATTYALSYVASLLNKPEKPSDQMRSVGQLSDRLHVVRSAVAPRNWVYGEIATSGPLVFVASEGTSNKFLHMVVVLTGHEVDAIGDIYFNDELLGSINPTTGVVNSGKFSGLVKVRKHLGVAGDLADADLVAANVGWTAAHKLSGCAYIYLKLTYDAKVFTSGIPDVKAIVRGRKVFDPRSGLTRWTDNWALCVRDYIVGQHGVQAEADEVDDAAFTEAANISDQQIDICTFSEEVTTDAGHGTLQLASPPAGYRLNTGDRVIFSTTDTLPSGVSAGVVYYLSSTSFGAGPHFYFSTSLVNAVAGVNVSISDTGDGVHTAHFCSSQKFTVASTTRLVAVAPSVTAPAEAAIDIRTGDIVQFHKYGSVTVTGLTSGSTYYAVRQSKTEVSLAATLANALAGTVISHGITIGAGGSVKLTQVSQRRYTCNGSAEASQTPRAVLQDMLTGGLGLISYAGGLYSLFAGAWRTPVADPLTEDDLRGAVSVQARNARRELFNAVRGTYADPSKAWQPGDFPSIRNATYKSQDGGEELWRDIKLNYTTNAQEAQRIGKVHLEAGRQGIAVTFPAKYTATRLSIGDIVPVSIARLGWVNKPLQVMSWTLAEGGGIDLSLREIAEAVYAWNFGDATHVDPAPDTALPDMATLDAPSSLLLESGQSTLLLAGDGTVVSRIKASWTGIDNAFLGGYELEFKKSTDADWQPSPFVGSATVSMISPVEDGLAYDVRVRAVSIFSGIFSVWEEVLGHNVAGKGVAPSNVSGFFVQQSGAAVLFMWNHTVDSDLAGYEIRFNPVGNSRWDDATPLTRVTKGTQITTIKTPPGAWNFMIKARDTTGFYSTNAAEFAFTVDSDYRVLATREESMLWELGTLTNFLIHGPTRALVPMSGTTAYTAEWNTFNQPIADALPICSYEAPPFDLGIDGKVRAYGAPISSLVQGTTGVADPQISVDYKIGAGSYDGFEPWNIGFVTGRHFKFKTTLTTGDGIAIIRSQKETIDADRRSESGAGLVVPISGVTVTFDKPFFFQPVITAVPVQGSGFYSINITAQSTTSVTFKLFYFDAGAAYNNVAVAGVINWKAEGV